ncbi:hypothetical protein LBRM_25_0570 [Leishmania braziliensis MHOM/BR/75/M2904]|uniref:Uncharacterized protein n=1 Tax=Leishmania braziliensis TaxID=5660 RepID=A4HE04_LEIBR|nr:hypothetical protein LBRM_25_0570 [Leishmania braziliensis MHOM/BR/75/M2904]KAI5690244.1 hypothetical protein MNV84_04404 [Leishmania braziliensis]CAJ2474084.1 unnamed protein product [Leishmania braziliensis]CAJ2474597.1 unnamed protein product [Leishmania braziliensis]CAM39056.1 hypothetical protein LBRM_25_0570 [Leishmania braziliensis MHOM/BR/75/M2904]
MERSTRGNSAHCPFLDVFLSTLHPHGTIQSTPHASFKAHCGTMDHRGGSSSSASRPKKAYHSNLGDDDVSANAFPRETFSDDQIQEIEQLLSRISNEMDDHEMIASSFDTDHVSSPTGVLVAQKNCEHNKMLSDRRQGIDADDKRDRIWKARIADVHTYLEHKKRDSINAIINKRKFREKVRQQRHWHRTRYHSSIPKLVPSLTDQFSKYYVQADDMMLFVEMRSR